MSLTNTQYEMILRSYEEKQLHNSHLLRERFEEIYRAIPEYGELEEQSSSISVAHARKLLSGDENVLPELKKALQQLAEQKHDLLLSNGYPADYLKPVFDCPECQDTGYVGSEKCHCFRNAISAVLYEQSNIRRMLDQENFSKLSYDFYEGEDLSRFQNAVDTCRKFVQNFSKAYQNLFFYGTVGTGKSFLSGCIAKELMDQGFSVIYFSASGLFEILSQYAFDYKAKEELRNIYQDIYGCDLLIIDDLGTELTNQFVNSQLFSCLNERHLRKKATIISTNHMLKQFSTIYSERIFSRITAHYQICKLTGPDIRLLMKRITNRK